MKKVIILSISILLVGLAAVLKSANPGSEKGVVESKLVIFQTFIGTAGSPGYIEVISTENIDRIELESETPRNHDALWKKIHSGLNKFIIQGYNIQSTSGDRWPKQYILVKE